MSEQSWPKHNVGNGRYAPTQSGKALLDPYCGVDPYLERPDSVALLLWWALGTPGSVLPVWASLLHRPGKVMTRADMLRDSRSVIDNCAGAWGVKPPRDAAIERDVAAFIGTFAYDHDGKAFEDSFTPFLGLRRLVVHSQKSPEDESKMYQLMPAEVSPELMAALTARYLAAKGTSSLSTEMLAITGGAPAALLGWHREMVVDAIQSIDQSHGMTLATVAGSERVSLLPGHDPHDVAARLLADLYGVATTATEPLLSPQAHDPLPVSSQLFTVAMTQAASVDSVAAESTSSDPLAENNVERLSLFDPETPAAAPHKSPGSLRR